MSNSIAPSPRQRWACYSLGLLILCAALLGCAQGSVPSREYPTLAPLFPASSPPRNGVQTGGATGHIVFVSNRDGTDEIFLMNVDGSDQRQLTHGGGFSWPSFSPDGKAILYEYTVAGRPQVSVMTADGQNPRPLASSDASDEFPAWSPDGSHIAFTSDRDGHAGIYVMNADGTGIKLLTDHPSNNWFPVWSPDGRSIAFISDRDGTHGNIFLMDSSGNHLEQITTEQNLAAKPTWAPDGQHIAAFTLGGIFGVTRDGANKRPITNEGEDPSWSPDGKWIAFASRRDAARLQIYLTSPDGSDIRRLTESSGEDWEPAWGP